MNETTEPLLEKWKGWLKQAAHIITDLIEKEEISFSEIVQMIQQHPDTSVMEQTWLGLTYRFYSLRLDNALLYMETRFINKGKTNGMNEERILFIRVHPSDDSPIVYRSYDEKSKLDESVKVPSFIKKAAPV
jgi:hypothetical protein